MNSCRLKVAEQLASAMALVLVPRTASADVAVTPFDHGLSDGELGVGIAIIVIVSGISWRALRAIRERKSE